MFGRFPQTSYEMRNPFIVLRFVLFGTSELISTVRGLTPTFVQLS